MRPPERLSDLIRLAVSDVLACSLPLNMNYIVDDLGGGICSVCFAGACLLQQKAATRLERCYPTPDELLDGWEIRHVSALDLTRQGLLRHAFLAYYNKSTLLTSEDKGYEYIVRDKDEFCRTMLSYADLIETYE